MESLIQSSPNANIYRRRATNPFSPRQATVSLHPWSNVPPRFLLRRLGKLLLSLLSGRYRTISRRSRSPFRFHLSINSSRGWRVRFLFEISAVIRVLCIRDELRWWEEERKARRKEESFGENTVLPGEHSNSLPGSRSFRFTRGHHGRGVVSPAITPTVILLYFAAHLFCPPPSFANQANILRPLFARLLGKMRHNRTPRHCLFCLVWKDSPPCKASAPFKYLWIFHKGAIAGSKGSNELFNNPRVKN